MPRDRSVCKWVSLREALQTFVLAQDGTQGSQHIKPLHWYVACRLVLEGGFLPTDITPRPPFLVTAKGSGRTKRHIPSHDPESGGKGERTILGGLKTKDVDVVVSKDGIGPCIAVSMKGMLNAFRNLTNRMEESVGDCTNLHIAYPALVYAFLHVMRANREGTLPGNARHFLKPDRDGNVQTADIALGKDGSPTDGIVRYHDVLSRLAGRNGIRNDLTRYEAVALTLVDPDPMNLGDVIASFPPAGSPLLSGDFFRQIYEQYDQRFIYSAPALAAKTRRLEWAADSPVLTDWEMAEFEPRTSG